MSEQHPQQPFATAPITFAVTKTPSPSPHPGAHADDEAVCAGSDLEYVTIEAVHRCVADFAASPFARLPFRPCIEALARYLMQAVLRPGRVLVSNYYDDTFWLLTQVDSTSGNSQSSSSATKTAAAAALRRRRSFSIEAQDEGESHISASEPTSRVDPLTGLQWHLYTALSFGRNFLDQVCTLRPLSGLSGCYRLVIHDIMWMHVQGHLALDCAPFGTRKKSTTHERVDSFLDPAVFPPSS